MPADVASPAAHAGADVATPVARIGPNAVIQLQAALEAWHGTDVAQRLFRAAGAEAHLGCPGTEMLDEAVPARLFRTLTQNMSRAEADAILADAGARTGAYILANRIPVPAQRLLAVLPRAIALRALLLAISKHAWTFAGSAQVACAYGRVPSITLRGNPLATPGCAWHVAVFEELFGRIVSPAILVRHTHCCAHSDAVCRTEFGFVARR